VRRSKASTLTPTSTASWRRVRDAQLDGFPGLRLQLTHLCSWKIILEYTTGGADGEINVWSLTDLTRVRQLNDGRP